MRLHPVTGVYKLHSGTDYPGNGCGTPIYAAAAGTVRATHPAWSGVLVSIEHGGGIVTNYGHMYGNDVVVKLWRAVRPLLEAAADDEAASPASSREL